MDCSLSIVGRLHGGNNFLRESGQLSTHLRLVAYLRTRVNETLDGVCSRGAGSRSPVTDIGDALTRVARVVLLDTFCGPGLIRTLEALLPTKLYSGATTELSALGSWVSARWRSHLGVGTAAIIGTQRISSTTMERVSQVCCLPYDG